MRYPSHRVGRLPAAALLALCAFASAVVGADEPAKISPAAAAEPKGQLVENSVVKVFATMRFPDAYKPWTKQAPSEATGTGVIIEGRRILTNAHVVLYASQVQIQGNQSGDKISATVESIAQGIDLAVLKLEDESFFDSRPPIPRASTLPDIKDAVLAYGYPTGGTSLSITKGIVSRIEFAGYNLSVSGLRIQIDAAINPGNSGGPAVVGDRMIGLAFSHLGGAQNIGYIIPCEEIELFLKDVADGRYDGKPAMFDDLQTLENPALRAFLRLDKRVQGMVVHEPFLRDDGYPLKEWDVITRIGATPIDDQGMIKLGPSLRVRFQYLIQQVARDGRVPLTIVRSGREMTVDLPAPAERPMLVPDLKGAYPSYFVFGPLVFTPVTAQFTAGFAGNAGAAAAFGAMGSPLITRRGDQPSFPGEQLVAVASPFFPHKLAQGYGQPALHVLKTVNGVPIRNLAHLVALIRDAREDFLTLEFTGRNTEGLVFNRQAIIAATEEILTDNGVRYQGSADALAVWNARPAAK